MLKKAVNCNWVNFAKFMQTLVKAIKIYSHYYNNGVHKHVICPIKFLLISVAQILFLTKKIIIQFIFIFISSFYILKA